MPKISAEEQAYIRSKNTSSEPTFDREPWTLEEVLPFFADYPDSNDWTDKQKAIIKGNLDKYPQWLKKVVEKELRHG